jgi:hypothetical protein
MEISRNGAAARPVVDLHSTTEILMKPNTKLIAGTALLLSISSSAAFAADGHKFCLNKATGGSSCGFTSMGQCQETMRGRNGWCSEQVDFTKSNYGGPENSFAYYPPAGKPPGRTMSQHDKDLQTLHEHDMPANGVGAE